MRYREQGELHLDFHGATCTTIRYIREKYGMAALTELFHAMADQVYKQMHEKLRQGDPTELLEFWQYFFEREHGKFTLTSTGAQCYELLVEECPAVKHVRNLGMKNLDDCCLQTQMLNAALCCDTPFNITTTKLGTCSCRQTITPREHVPSFVVVMI